MEFPGAYVFGSNDYYGPKLRNPARYLVEKTQGAHGLNGNAAGRPTPSTTRGTTLRDAFDDAGWVGLNNTRGRLKLDDGIEIGADGPGRPAHQAGPVRAGGGRPGGGRGPLPRAWSTRRTCGSWTPSPPTATR